MDLDEKEVENKFEEYKSDTITEEELNMAEEKAGFLGEMKYNFELLIRMVQDHFAGFYEIPMSNLVVIIGCILYVLSPIDAVFDFIPFIGYLDDILVVTLVYKQLKELIEDYKESGLV